MNGESDIEREAAAWVVKISNPNCTQQELAALDIWLGLSSEHDRQFRELHAVWNNIHGSGDPTSVLAASFGSLAPRCLKVFVLYKIHKYTCAQISAHLGISQRKVRKLLEEAARHFEEALGNQSAHGRE
jgi:ferric-dicitrate binding protein FerR (iron transport regulator)